MDLARALIRNRRAAALLVSSALASSVLGCTTMTVPVLPDAGPLPQDAQADGGNEPDATLPPPVVETCTPDGMGSTLGQSCTSDETCDDGCFCNGSERCAEGACVAGADPCADSVECTADVCLEEADRCFNDPRHEMCSNGDACDGTELCDLSMGCRPGAPPYCNDDTSCTLDSCDTELSCVFTPRDLDGDGFNDGRCGGEDCDDDPRFGTNIYPGATEDCMNRRDDDCDGMRDYNDGADCVPTNDTCESAVVLPGAGTYSGSTAGLESDFTLGCRASGPDAVFRFALTEPHDVQVTIAGAGSGAAVSIRPWAQCASGPDDKCSDTSPPTFLRRSLPAGEYAIIVQSSGSGAPFDLNLRISDPTPIPPVDVCDGTTLDLCGGEPCTTLSGATFTGMFVEVEDDYTLSCSSTDRRDAVYTFTIDEPKDVTLRASSSSTTYLALTTNCSSTSAERRCDYGSTAEILHRELGPGTYFVVLESSSTSAASWTLTATITDPVPRQPGDACSTAVDISEAVLGGGGSGMVSLSTLELDSGVSCGGTASSYHDANFVFTLPETRDVVLTTDGPSATYYTALQSACGDDTSNLRCWSGTGMQRWRSLPAGTYYVTLSTYASSGTVSASIMTGEPTPVPANDRCDGAILLESGVARTDTTVDFEDDIPGGSCAGTTSRPDAFYRFTLTERTLVAINARDTDTMGGSQLWLTLRASCDNDSMVHACVAGPSGGGPATIFTELEPGDYVLTVESTSSAATDFNIVATF